METEVSQILGELGLTTSEPGQTYYSMVVWYGQAVMDRALELSKGQPPEANFMPYVFKALEEARAADGLSKTCLCSVSALCPIHGAPDSASEHRCGNPSCTGHPCDDAL